MDTILVKCDSIITGINESVSCYPASIECANTNCYDVYITGIICGTVVFLAILMLIAFWSKLHEKEIGTKAPQDVPSEEKEAVPQNKNKADKNGKEQEYKKELEKRFLSFCENHINENDSLKGKLLDDYKKVLDKYGVFEVRKDAGTTNNEKTQE